MVRLFSIPAFFIVFRESLEACLVLGVTHAYFRRIGTLQYIRLIWISFACAFLCALAVGIGLRTAFNSLGKTVFSGRQQHIFEGSVFLVAACMMSYMIVWVMMTARDVRSRLEQHLESIVQEEHSTIRRKVTIFSLIFIHIFREGVETFIFLFGAACSQEHPEWTAIPLPSILGIGVAALTSFTVFSGLLRLNISTFLNLSGFVLIAFATGLFSHAFHELQEGEVFGEWKNMENRPWFNFPMWDISDCCDHDANEFFAMLRMLLGYSHNPNFLEWIAYFTYWAAILPAIAAINWQRLLAFRDNIRSQTQTLLGVVTFCTFIGTIFSFADASWIALTTMPISFVLSLLTISLTFDVIYPYIIFAFPHVARHRRAFIRLACVLWIINAVFILALHLAQIICEGTEKGNCTLRMFFFFGLLLNKSFCEKGRTIEEPDNSESEKGSWPTIAVLTVSATICAWLFGCLAFRIFLLSKHIANDGSFLGDDDVPPRSGTTNHTVSDRSVQPPCKIGDSTSDRFSVLVDDVDDVDDVGEDHDDDVLRQQSSTVSQPL